MNTYIAEMIKYLGKRLQGVFHYKHLIEEIKMEPWYGESYGKGYYRIYVDVKFNDSIDKLNLEETELLNFFFANSYSGSGSEFVSYLIKDDQNEEVYRRNYLKNLKAFYDAYTYITTFMTEVMIGIIPNANLKILSLEKYPEFNYMNQYWNDINFSKSSYYLEYNRRFSRDVYQCFSLFRKANELKKTIKKNTILISDWDLCEYSFVWEISDLRSLVLKYDIPFIIKGGKTVEEILIDAIYLKDVITSKIEDNDTSTKEMRLAVLNEKLDNTTKALNKKEQFLKDYPIKVGDILLLVTDELVEVCKIEFYGKNILFSYLKINQNLKTGKRSGDCYSQHIISLIPSSEYQILSQDRSWNNIKSLMRFMKKQKKVKLKNFTQ